MNLPNFAAAAVMLVGPAVVSAQTWRTLEVSRQLHDSSALRVRVTYGVGRFDLRPTAEPVLYSVQLRYDEAAGRPLYHFDPAQHLLVAGVENQGFHLSSHGDDEGRREMLMTLSQAVPLDLTLDLGATNATIELGGLSLRSLHMNSGAAEAAVRFSSPNRTRLDGIDVNVGAASFTAENLANANTSSVTVASGVGSVELDFGGHWTQDMSLNVGVALGKLVVHVPNDVGMQVEIDKLFASFDPHGLVKRGNLYQSENFERSPFKLRIRAQTKLGDIELDHGTP